MPGLIDSFCTVASLKVSAIIVYDVATKVLGTEVFPQYDIADLNSSITFIVLFSQGKPLRWKEINTHTHTQHTHIHTFTHRSSTIYSSSCNVAPAISRVLIGRYLIFCSPTCCSFPRKCMPAKYKGLIKHNDSLKIYRTITIKKYFRIF